MGGKRTRRSARTPQSGDTRRAILDAAAKLFVEQGYEKFSLRQVAAAIGYTPTTIYLYFADKDDLLYHVAMEGFKYFGASLQAGYASTADPIERLKAIGRTYVRFGLENPVYYRLMFMERGDFLDREPPEGFEAPVDSFGILMQTLTDCLEAGLIKEGNPAVYAAALWSTVHGIVSLTVGTSNFDPSEVDLIQETAYDMVIEGLRQGATPGPLGPRVAQ